MSGASVWHVVEYQYRTTKRFWVGLLTGSVVTPVMYVLALGVGLGTVVDAHSGTVQGVPYLQFVGPAFLAAATTQIAGGMASYPILGGFKWLRTFHAMAATPLTPAQICNGQLLWMAIRLSFDATVYLGVIAAVGGVRHPGALLAIPIAVLLGLAFAAPLTAWSAFIENEGSSFNVVRRFILVPMFLFSGTFYPISRLPEWARWLAYATPLWHGTELCRGVAIGGLSAASVAIHLGYLVILFIAGTALAQWRFRLRLTA